METLSGQHKGGGGKTRSYITGGGTFRTVPGETEMEDFFTEKQ